MSVFLYCASYRSVAGTVSQNRAGYSGGGHPNTHAGTSFLVSKLSSISTLLGSRRKICQRVLLGTWFTRYGTPLPVRCCFIASKPRLLNAM